MLTTTSNVQRPAIVALTTTTTTTTVNCLISKLQQLSSKMTISKLSHFAGCVDQVNPSTGVSECAAKAYLCTRPGDVGLMRKECPKTCGYF
uniref:ShKT domain-containing protein n=1 Tax=Caenorhabditis japonica TaxID=281687 RepID=A0A8R1EI82_CAEJA